MQFSHLWMILFGIFFLYLVVPFMRHNDGNGSSAPKTMYQDLQPGDRFIRYLQAICLSHSKTLLSGQTQNRVNGSKRRVFDEGLLLVEFLKF